MGSLSKFYATAFLVSVGKMEAGVPGKYELNIDK